jgi:hypothetical protein
MMPSTKNATNITLDSKPAPQNTGTMVQYVSNATLHADLGISYVQDVIHQKYNTRNPGKPAPQNKRRKEGDSKESGQLT